jgi:hypothetical protein
VRFVGLLVLSGCTSIFGLDKPQLHGDAAIDGLVHDATDDARLDATPYVPWGNITLAFPSAFNDDDPTLTGDMLELYFNRNADIYVTTRTSVIEAWGTPARVLELSHNNAVDGTPKVSADGVLLTLTSNRPQSAGYDIWATARTDRTEPWSSPVHFTAVASSGEEIAGTAPNDGLSYVFASNRDGNFDLFVTTRATNTATIWTSPQSIPALNSAAADRSPFITGDGQTIYFDSNRGGVFAIYVAQRSGTQWGAPQPITELSAGGGDAVDPWVSPDGRTMYFTSSRGGNGPRIYRATR